MNRIWMKRPASWAGELWRESLPLGNGRVSALLCGSVGCEHLWVNRFDRWEGGRDGELPDVSDTLAQTRAWIAQGRYAEANELLSKTLRERGYQVELATPMAPVEVRLRFESEQVFRHYRRGVDLDRGEAFVSFDQGEDHIERRAFVSHADDTAALEVGSTGRLSVKIDRVQDERLKVRVLLPAGGESTDHGAYIEVKDAPKVCVLARFDEMPSEESYDALLSRHLPEHRAAMGDAWLDLGGGDHNTEWLLDEAAEEEASVELYEKLWRYGRYLFVCGTAEGGNPFPLYGLWGGKAQLMWAQNVANINVEMMYWHALAGGHANLLRPLIHYYYEKMDAFREAARKLFGCRGIYVSTYTTPMNSYPAPNVPVIVNFIGCAGWLSQHFYDYYRYTGDEELLKREILPFMLEAAAFYEDYVTRDAAGKIAIVPSVSPENTPGCFMPEDFQMDMGHINPVVWNSTVDFAIMKELLSHLLELSEVVSLDPQRVARWKTILADVPEYMVNDDGALREWMDEQLPDFYQHRHLSHLYALFPGREIVRGDKLFAACERAVDLRELGAMSGWALTFMAAMYARMGRGDASLDCLNTLAKGCLLPNLFTLHNDWRDMGVSLRFNAEPVQLDALMGSVNALQEMLLNVSGSTMTLLPACPAKLAHGEARNWRFPGGCVSFSWDRSRNKLTATISAQQDVTLHIEAPEWSKIAPMELALCAGETKTIG